MRDRLRTTEYIELTTMPTRAAQADAVPSHAGPDGYPMAFRLKFD